MYEDWGKRPADFSQIKLLATLQEKFKSFQSAQVAVLPPSPIPGLGNAFGFQMVVEDRGGAGLSELQKTVQQILNTAQNRPGFLRIGFTTFSASNPQLYLDIDRTMAKSLGVTSTMFPRRYRVILGSTYVNLFNKFNQSFQVARAIQGRLSPAVGGYRQSLRRQPV
jgi:HAE1 family hydrophobic/amphiphilic exporter-1